MGALLGLFDTPVEQGGLRTKMRAEKVPLTYNALQRIKSGEIIQRPVIQIMSFKLVDSGRNQCLVLLANDGRSIERVSCTPALTKDLMVMQDQLQLSVLKMDKFAIVADRFEISEMTWLNLGSNICYNTDLQLHRTPLSVGFLENFMERGKRMSHPIVQILKIQAVRNGSESKPRVRLVIHDGLDFVFAYLSTQLGRSQCGALFKRSIVRLDNYKANHLSHNERSSITVYALTVLNLGSIIDFVWKLTPTVPTLSHGFIRSLVIGELLAKPIVKIVKVSFCFNFITEKHQLRLLIYDGIKTCHAILPGYMNYLLDCLNDLPTVRLDKYTTLIKNNSENERMLVVFEMTGLSLRDHGNVPNKHELQLMRATLPDINL